MNLGKRLGIAFERSGLRVPDVARKLGISATSINALIRRDSERSGFTEKFLGLIPPDLVNHDWVRTGQGSPEPVAYQGRKAPSQIKETDNEHMEPSRAANLPIAQSIHPGGTKTSTATPLRSWDYQSELPAEGDWVFVPRLGTVPSTTAGGKELMKSVRFLEELQTFRADWIRDDKLSPAALVWSQARDASMQTVIAQDDHYVIDTSDTDLIDGKVYSLWYGGSERARRVFRMPNGGLQIVPANPVFPTIEMTAEEAKALHVVGRVVHRSGKGGL